MHDIFISYSSKQKSIADGVCHYLEENGYKCWMAPRDIPAGSAYGDLIDEAIVSSKLVVLVFSESASLSKWVKGEINVAFDEDKYILPFRVDDTSIAGGFRVMLNQMHWVDAYPHYSDKLPVLLESVANLIGKRKSPEASSFNLKVSCDQDCLFFVDGIDCGSLDAGKIKAIPLNEGEYSLKFVSVENEKDVVELDFEMPRSEKRLNVSLSSVRDERQKLEEQRLLEEECRKQQEEDAKLEFAVKGEFVVNDVAFKMVFVKGGHFMMGADNDDKEASFDERPKHGVTLSDYYIGETVVTQALWTAVMGDTPFFYKNRPQCPAESIAWKRIVKPGGFLDKLNVLLSSELPSSWTFRLPTEAEWEYAARGGQKSKGYKYSGSNNIEDVAWYKENSNGKTHPVKQKEPNELGLYDMSGNVAERCIDISNLYKEGEFKDPIGKTKGWLRVGRGGNYSCKAKDLRVSGRGIQGNDMFCGFRLVLQISGQPISL